MKLNKRSNITIEPKYIYIGIIILCIIMGILSFRFSDRVTPVRNAISSAVMPMQKGINSIGVVISEKIDYLHTMKNLVKENKKLKNKVEDLSEENQLLQRDKYELETFRQLYELDKDYADYPKVAARVISSDGDNWYNSFVIDKGSNDGISKNMNVIADGGLVGIVTQVNDNYSRVRSIIDDESNVSGTFVKSENSCIVSGSLTRINSGVLDLTDISTDSKIEEGDEVVTSQISNKYLPGILIGYCKNITNNKTNLTLTGELVPAVNFQNLDMVLVITEVKASDDLEDILN
ncbi:MAG: rod shape-determining protein MreC [Lachnospiraceae bacterium]|nr:rod shape-determining protein MreC [Lachnospiraceae bacterium]